MPDTTTNLLVSVCEWIESAPTKAAAWSRYTGAHADGRWSLDELDCLVSALALALRKIDEVEQ